MNQNKKLINMFLNNYLDLTDACTSSVHITNDTNIGNDQNRYFDFRTVHGIKKNSETENSIPIFSPFTNVPLELKAKMNDINKVKSELLLGLFLKLLDVGRHTVHFLFIAIP